jgi:tetratricopeptide (TPR) repeat protein
VRASLWPVLVLSGWLAALPSLPDFAWRPHLPAWAERVLYNSRERTERARESYGKGEAKAAAGQADTALRLRPNEPIAQFNDGTAHLAAGNEKKAIENLERAAKGAGPRLAPDAYYNIGNARLAAGDASGAVAAYRETLLREPERQDAKFNLELALRKEREQKAPVPGKRPGQTGRNDRSQAPAPGGKQGEPGDQDQGAPKPGEGPESRQGGAPPQSPQPRPGGGDARLKGFRNQPDMSAGEAAALLNAVENLERQQRREQAEKRARQRAAQDKDW